MNPRDDGASEQPVSSETSSGGGMPRIRVVGGHRLEGRISICGAKNAALPLMTAALLMDDTLTLKNLPHLADIETLSSLLTHHGVAIEVNGGDGANHGRVAHLCAAKITDTTAPYDLVRKMRASVLVLGPILARCGEARVSQPGGCAIGTRPVDLHLKGLEQLGAEIDLDGGYIDARAPNGLVGGQVVFPFVSVGATENLMMAATLARGQTTLVNAAREPEVQDLAHCLVSMGAKIDGIGTDTVTIEGVDRLHSAEHAVLPDRIETGTYAIAAAITGGELTLDGADLAHIESFAETLRAAGVDIQAMEDGVRVSARNGIVGVDAMTEPYPGFPTDLQAQFMALMAVAEGAAMVTESIFENRFMHVPELARMGANITLHGGSALVRGVARMTGAPVMATDLRASVSLVLAGLAASGETMVSRIYHLDRGYERVEEKLAACGAEIERVRD
jgi:UDP-N-acetylglucosamine 1-carboxyvinyltransferase